MGPPRRWFKCRNPSIVIDKRNVARVRAKTMGLVPPSNLDSRLKKVKEASVVHWRHT
jgi:hypothetical protein